MTLFHLQTSFVVWLKLIFYYKLAVFHWNIIQFLLYTAVFLLGLAITEVNVENSAGQWLVKS